MKTTKQLTAAFLILNFAFCIAWAAPEEYVTKSASGSTAATVYFEPGQRTASLIVADVTSDKATSVLNWRVGGQQLTILKAVPATVISNILTTVSATSAYGLNSNIVSVTAAGTVTAHTAGTNSLVTNAVITLHNPIGTNLAVSDRIRERTSTYYQVQALSSSNIVSVSTNSAVTNGNLYLLTGAAGQFATNTLTSYTTNGANYDLNFTNAFTSTFNPDRVYVLTTNLYSVDFVAGRTATDVYLTSGTGLADGDTIVITPATGGTFVNQVNANAAYIYQNQTISAATGIALAAGDSLFVLGPDVNTPVGAATLRLMADPVRILPAGLPARLQVDGTSAVSINAAIVRYK